jgi:hypothetical protein
MFRYIHKDLKTEVKTKKENNYSQSDALGFEELLNTNVVGKHNFSDKYD